MPIAFKTLTYDGLTSQIPGIDVLTVRGPEAPFVRESNICSMTLRTLTHSRGSFRENSDLLLRASSRKSSVSTFNSLQTGNKLTKRTPDAFAMTFQELMRF